MRLCAAFAGRVLQLPLMATLAGLASHRTCSPYCYTHSDAELAHLFYTSTPGAGCGHLEHALQTQRTSTETGGDEAGARQLQRLGKH